MLIAILADSTSLPVDPAQGLAVQAATALVSVPLACLAAIPAAFFGYVGQMMVACPKFIPQEEIAKRRLDVDLVRDFLKFCAAITLHALVVLSVVIVWLGGRDAALLAALSLLAAGSINITNSVTESENSEKIDWLFAPVYLLAYAAVCALRIAGLHWFICVLPLPLFAVIVPAIRWFFPRSGLRGTERRAAIADMPSRFKSDIRSDAEKSRDGKARSAALPTSAAVEAKGETRDHANAP